jgi:hypothetical protein
MPPLFAFSDFDLSGLICWIIMFWPVLLLSLCTLLFVLRWWNALPTNKCPRCRAEPPALDVHNVCWKCGCVYDKWGNILKDALGPPHLNEVDLARFTPRGNTANRGEGSPEFKADGEVRL